MSAPKVNFCDDGEFDETWVHDAFVHIERMDDTAYWIGVRGSDNDLMINTGVYRGEWYFNVEEDKIGGKSFSVRRPRNSKTELPSRAKDPRKHCAIIGESDLHKLVVKYLGGAKENITSDEREILLFALYNESVERGGLAKAATEAMDARYRVSR